MARKQEGNPTFNPIIRGRFIVLRLSGGRRSSATDHFLSCFFLINKGQVMGYQVAILTKLSQKGKKISVSAKISIFGEEVAAE